MPLDLNGQLVDHDGTPIPDDVAEHVRKLCASAAESLALNLLQSGSALAYAEIGGGRKPSEDNPLVGLVVVCIDPRTAHLLLETVKDMADPASVRPIEAS